MATLNTTTKYIRIPKLNPMRWLKAENGLDDYFKNEIPAFETQTNYLNTFQTNDPVNSQIVFNMDEVDSYQMTLINCYDKTFLTATAQTLYTDSDNWRYVHFNLNLLAQEIAEGIYYVLLKVTLRTAQIEYYITEPIDLKIEHENSIYLDYSNGENDFGMIFSTTAIKNTISLGGASGISLQIPKKVLYRLRVKGGYWSDNYQPSSDDVVYNNQIWDAQLVSSIPYIVEKLTIGDGKGIPNYLADIINRIFSCDYLYISGIRKTKADGAKLESVGERGFPMMAWEIDVMLYDNEYEDEYSTVMVQQPTGIGSFGIGFNFYVT